MNTKIIFLDNDGVICLSNNWGTRKKKYIEYLKSHPGTPMNSCPINVSADNLDKKAIQTLNKIISETDADIVVSSDWRYHWSLNDLGEYYISQGLIKKPIDITSFVKDIDPRWWIANERYALSEHERVIEIKHWLSLHPEVTNWVAVDDLNLGIYDPYSGDIFNEDGLTNFVHTRKPNEGIKQTGIKEKVIKFLNE